MGNLQSHCEWGERRGKRQFNHLVKTACIHLHCQYSQEERAASEREREETVTHTSNNILNLEIRKLRVEPKLLNDPRVLPRRQPRVVLRLGTGNDDFPRGEHERGRFRFADSHDYGCLMGREGKGREEAEKSGKQRCRC
jgi:hypothetical protein